MDLSNLESDIPIDIARAAHRHTSFVPEQRAEQERRNYTETLRHDYNDLLASASTIPAFASEVTETPEPRLDILDDEFQRYRQGYRNRYVAMLQTS